MEKPKDTPKKIAIVHDWLISVGGAEKVLGQFLLLFPEADLFSALDFMEEEERKRIIHGRHAKTSIIGKLPFAKKAYRFFIPFFYKSIEKLDLKEYDIILSSSHSIAKGVKKHPHQKHICYCHTPMRYVWNMKKTYLNSLPVGLRTLALKQFNKLREWDFENSKAVDYFIANSHFIATRIKQNYARESAVIHPPVDDNFYFLPEKLTPIKDRSGDFLVVSRLVNYKKIDLIVEAFNALPQYKLTVIGAGPQLKKLKQLANSNITFLGFQSKEVVREHLQQSRALVLAAIEDFGITSLQAQSCGTPVIALGFGGYLESIKEGETGLFYPHQKVESLIAGIRRFEKEKGNFDVHEIRKHAESFSSARFRNKIQLFFEEHGL